MLFIINLYPSSMNTINVWSMHTMNSLSQYDVLVEVAIHSNMLHASLCLIVCNCILSRQQTQTKASDLYYMPILCLV